MDLLGAIQTDIAEDLDKNFGVVVYQFSRTKDIYSIGYDFATQSYPIE